MKTSFTFLTYAPYFVPFPLYFWPQNVQYTDFLSVLSGLPESVKFHFIGKDFY